MPVNADGYSPNGDNNAWKSRTAANVTGQGTNAASHAERTAFAGMHTRTGPFAIVQDAFPCFQCDNWFTDHSTTYSVVFKVTANNGAYSADHGFGQDYDTFPTYIWYHAGAKTIAANPPNGFPQHPSLSGL